MEIGILASPEVPAIGASASLLRHVWTPSLGKVQEWRFGEVAWRGREFSLLLRSKW
jgi:hypothetical protein